MIITLAIVIGMIVMIMSDKFAFGAPPLIACVLLVLTGCATMSEAFAGFVDKNVIMIAGFMVVMAALEKTSLIDKVKATMFNMASKGGYRNYILLLIVVMLGASVMSGTGYYVLVLSLVSTIPYNKNLPISKIFMPLGYATYNPIVPVNMAFYVGLVASLLESSGVTGTAVPLLVYSGIKLVSSIAFLVWAVIGYRFLPDHPIAEAGAQASEQKSEGEKLSRWKEIVVYIAFVVNFVAMIFLDKLGEPGYAIPGVIAAVLFVLGILNFKEVRNNIASPLAGALGTSVSPFVIVLVFTLLTSLSATFTGASFGSLFVFAPIAISACVSMGLDPTAVAVACVTAAWINWIMPIDGMPAMILGMGKYKLVDFWKFTLPLYVIQILVLCGACVIVFPM